MVFFKYNRNFSAPSLKLKILYHIHLRTLLSGFLLKGNFEKLSWNHFQNRDVEGYTKSIFGLKFYRFIVEFRLKIEKKNCFFWV